MAGAHERTDSWTGVYQIWWLVDHFGSCLLINISLMFVCVTKFGTRFTFIAATFRGSLYWPVTNYALNSCLLNNNHMPSWNLHSTKILSRFVLAQTGLSQFALSYSILPSQRHVHPNREFVQMPMVIKYILCFPFFMDFYQNSLTCRKKIQQCTWGLRIWAIRFLRLLGFLK